MILEICANSYESALNAEKGGADRIELCSELALGGITPSYGLIKKVMNTLSIPVNVLIRPRSGDFTYTEEEFEVMKEDIALCRELKCNGVVSGVLNKDQELDVARTGKLIELAGPMSFTFHRAFDWVPDHGQTLEELINLGAERILSSGQSSNAFKGLPLLKTLLKQADNRITILPGGGINKENVLHFRNEGFTEVHFSAGSSRKTTDIPQPSMVNLDAFDEGRQTFSDIQKIQEIRNITT
ncbi:copper homeostasis protein CutC [Leptobacterium flavescens]|uniref:PF03932 family protein CutC n=1 Tax=Leptobacterium flavescens TaxID=472055 RepID=A0A6P0UP55_9FLAO|nr:copper homeostasis protein CutC [Leptobacterium flavescens]NER12703.1 copper homeostasis protein CutC [Leptobacterium flavescens]